MLRDMRVMLFAAVCASALAVPASAAQVDPKALVVQQRDVPAEFRLDRAQTGVVTNSEVRVPYEPTFVARSGRITGYVVQYVHPDRDTGVQSGADVFRRPAGARMMLARGRETWRKLAQGDPWGRAGIGTESWALGGSVDTIVLWRYDRIFAVVLGVGMTKQRTLALARIQQRRIAAALG